jgi:hypothetical protein
MEKIVLKELSDSQLLEIVKELQKETFEENSIVRKLAIQFFGSDSVNRILQISIIILPVVAERMKCYSPHIEK